MDQIGVNTNDLRSGSQNLNSSANEIGNTQNQLSRTNSSIGNAYDGQLRRAIEGITGDIHPKGTQLQNRSLELSDELISRANRFENANEAGGSAMLVMSYQFSDFIQTSPILELFSSLSKADLAKASLFWGLGGFGLGGIIGLVTVLPKINLINSYKNVLDWWNIGEKFVSTGFTITHFGWSPRRPNSLIFFGPNRMREAIGIKAMTRVIKPATLLPQMALIQVMSDLVDAGATGISSFFDPRYSGTSRALPAGLLDGEMKLRINLNGTAVLIGASALLIGLGGIVSAPVWLVGGAVVGTWVAGGFLLDKYYQSPAWEKWSHSETRATLINTAGERMDKITGFLYNQIEHGVSNAHAAFDGFIQALLPDGA